MIVTTELRASDSLRTAADLSAGDIVYFERVGPTAVDGRLVTADLLPQLEGPLFVLEMNESVKRVTFRQVSREELAID